MWALSACIPAGFSRGGSSGSSRLHPVLPLEQRSRCLRAPHLSSLALIGLVWVMRSSLNQPLHPEEHAVL